MAARTNYHTNPRLIDANANDVPDGNCFYSESVAGDPVRTVTAGAGFLGGGAWRSLFTSSSDVNKQVIFEVWTAAGTIAAGDIVTFSCYVKGAWAGTSPRIWGMVKSSVPADNQYLADGGAISSSSSWVRASYTTPALNAGADSIRFYLTTNDINAGDVHDIQLSNVLIEKSAVLGPYFDGSYSFCHWAGPADASISIDSGLTVAPTQLLRPKFMPQGRVICNG